MSTCVDAVPPSIVTRVVLPAVYADTEVAPLAGDRRARVDGGQGGIAGDGEAAWASC